MIAGDAKLKGRVTPFPFEYRYAEITKACERGDGVWGSGLFLLVDEQKRFPWREEGGGTRSKCFKGK